jgi:predicted PurR-regulated permease PerM
MRNNTPIPRDNNDGQFPVFWITALIGVVTSLFIGVLTLSRRRQGGSSPAGAGGPASTSGTLPGEVTVGDAGSAPGVVKTSDGVSLQAQPGSERAAFSTRWSPATKYVVGVGLFLFLVFVIFFSRSVLSMITLAALLAFVVHPVVNLFQRRLKMKRGLAVGLAYLLVVILLIIIPLVIIPAVIKAINNVLAIDWQAIGESLAASLAAAAQNVSSIPVIGPSLSETLDSLSQLITGTAALETPDPIVVDVSVTSIGQRLAQTLGTLAKILGPLISAITSLIFMLLISLRMSLASQEMREAYPRLFPSIYNSEINRLVERLIRVWSSFMRGQLSLMAVMGVLTYLLNLLLGTPYPLFLGVLAGLLEIIPNLGPILATIPAVIFALVFGSSYLPVSNFMFALIVIAGYILLSFIENQYLVPKIMGDAVELHPLVVIIGVVIGGATFGILGILLATPVISTIKEIVGYLYNKILEPPPETAPPEEKASIMDTVKGFTKRFRLSTRLHKKISPPEPAAANQPEEALE